MIETIDKPSGLTNQFVRLLHQSQGNHSGYFQIVQFHQKRQKYYSTHISDGYFKCKVIFREKPSKQIDRGEIKLFSILSGVVANQGNRILMVFNQLKCWDYPRTIGVIRSWKFQSANNYVNGSNFIQWFQDGEKEKGRERVSFDSHCDQSDNETGSVASYCTSEVNLRKNSSLSSKLEKKESAQHQVFSFGAEGNQNSLEQTQTCQESLYQGSTQSIILVSEKKSKPETVLANQKGKKLLIVPESQSESNKKVGSSQKYSNRKGNIQKIERVSQVASVREHSDKISSAGFKQKSNQDEDDYDLMQDIKQQAEKLRMMKFQAEVMDDINKSMQKNKKERQLMSKGKIKSVFETLIESGKKQKGLQPQSNSKSSIRKNEKPLEFLPTPKKFTSKLIEVDDNDLEQILHESQEKETSFYRIGNEVAVGELTIGNQGINFNRKWINISVLCCKFILEGNASKLVVVAEEYGDDCGHIFNMVLSGGDLYCPFEEGEAYQMSMSGFKIQEPIFEQVPIQIELRNVAQDVRARKLKLRKQKLKASKPHFSFTSLERIQTLKDGLSINTVAVVYRYKNILIKKGLSWINTFTLIDPFTGNCIDFTIFDAHKLIHEPGSPVVIFNGITNYYRGKITLNVKNYTFYYFGKDIVYDKFCPFIYQLERIKEWQDEGKTVADIEDKSRKYRLIYNLFQAQVKSDETDQESMNVETPICRITKISPYFFRLICDKCTKNLTNGLNCFNCGRRENPLKQLQLSILVSDNSHSIFVQFNHYDSISWIGEEGEKMEQFAEAMMHKRVKLWLVLNPKYKASVIKMEIIEEERQVQREIEELRTLLKYL